MSKGQFQHRRRPGPQVSRHNAGPSYWMNETGGALRPAILAYLKKDRLDETSVSLIRAYLRQWIEKGDWFPSPTVETLRRDVDGLTSREAIDTWLAKALDAGIDPL
jgi:hypothetical protein